MKEKILALLETKFQGKRKDGLNRLASAIALQVNTEEEANTIVGNLTAENVDAFIADWRRETDAEIGKSNKTHEDNLRKKFDFTEKKQEEKKTEVTSSHVIDKNGTIDVAAFQKFITDSITAATKPLTEKLAALETGNVTKTRQQTLNDKLKDCKNETLKSTALKNFARMTFATDDDFSEYLSDMEKDIKTANQQTADSSLAQTSRPWVNTAEPGKEASDAEISAVMEKLHI
jgi:hypothetical protein